MQKLDEERLSVTNRANRILVLGASGMLGNAVFRFFSQSKEFEVFGSVRTAQVPGLLQVGPKGRVIGGIDVQNHDALNGLFTRTRPDIVVNCVGMIKQLKLAEDPLVTLSLNTLLPHQIAQLCGVAGARFIHISTDCVFSGERGMYTEEDTPDARDLYGRSKYLGEVYCDNAITLRTSIIGREISGGQSLVDWFLSQEDRVKGYARAIFSGMPTVELARVIRDHVIPFPDLQGVYHVSAEPISKCELLKLVAQVYGKTIQIQPDGQLIIDRSLDSSRFRKRTGYSPKSWPEMVRQMHDFG
jgi:dTDP-4-dehydrorhamnose reductase